MSHLKIVKIFLNIIREKVRNLALCQRNIVKAVCSNSPGHPQRLLVLSVFMKNYIIIIKE